MVDRNWIKDGEQNGWEMPRAAWWKRLPVIRHFRAAALSRKVASHEAMWATTGALISGYDRWVLYGIAKGQERPLSRR